MRRPRLLDLFCGAGGCSVGYHRAGFDVVGVDSKPQPRYPFEFHQADAMTFPLDGFAAIHASPPCQAYSTMTKMHKKSDHPDLVAAMRELLIGSGTPYVIENVSGSPLRDPVMLCGTMFGLGVKVANAELRRHRLFETSFFMLYGLQCRHSAMRTIGVFGDHGNGSNTLKKTKRLQAAGLIRPRTVGVWGNSGGMSVRDGVHQFCNAERSEAMGIDWMTGKELSQAIPPAYTEYIGTQLMRIL